MKNRYQMSISGWCNHLSQAEYSCSNCLGGKLTLAQRRSSAARRHKYATVSSDQDIRISHMKLCW